MCSSCEMSGATGGISFLKMCCYMCCLFVYLYFSDCYHVLLSTMRHSLGFVPANHRQLSLSILDQLCDWRSHFLGKKRQGPQPIRQQMYLKKSFRHNANLMTTKSKTTIICDKNGVIKKCDRPNSPITLKTPQGKKYFQTLCDFSTVCPRVLLCLESHQVSWAVRYLDKP